MLKKTGKVCVWICIRSNSFWKLIVGCSSGGVMGGGGGVWVVVGCDVVALLRTKS